MYCSLKPLVYPVAITNRMMTLMVQTGDCAGRYLLKHSVIRVCIFALLIYWHALTFLEHDEAQRRYQA